MRLFQKVALAAAFLPLVASPVSAQRWKWDVGINGGYSWMTNMLGEDQTLLSGDEVGGSKIRFEHGWLVGQQIGYWPWANVGFRTNFRYAERDIVGNNIDDFSFVDAVNLWGGTIDLLYRFKSPAAEYNGTEFLPYIAGGAGIKWHNPGGDEFNCVDLTEAESFTCGPFTTGLPGNPLTFALAENSVFTGLIGLGADWRVGRNWAIRTEISDQIFRPAVYQADQVGLSDTYNLVNGRDKISKTVHEIGGQIGVHMLFGVPRPTPVVVVPAPPAPTPPPPPPPPAPPREESITVCVIDPVAPGGIRTESAIFLPERGDTLVTVNGQRVPLRSSIGSVMVATSADWYVRGAPMTMMIGTQKVEFVTTNTPRIVEASELAFLGTVNGLPVYADKDDVADVRQELDELNRAQRGTDLAKILEEHKDLRTDLADVKIFYVPMQPTGCVFQALQMQEQVRKNKQQQQ